MRWLFVTRHAYPPERQGGSERSTHELALALRERGHRPAVLAGTERRARTHARRWIAAARRRDPCPAELDLGYPVFRALDPSRAAPELAGRIGADVAVVQAGAPLATARPLLESGCPTVVYLRNAELQSLGGEVRAHPRLLFLANSRFVAARFRAAFGIEPAAIPPLVRAGDYRVQSRRRNATFVGPVRRKGVETAFALAQRRPDVPFRFVESWPLSRRELRRLARRARALGNVELRRSTGDMRGVYRDAKLLLVPSVWEEAWGRVVTEAQLSGIPVLASDRGGLPESVGPGGILVPADADLADWEKALSALWDDEDHYDRLARAALEHARRPEIQPEALVGRLVAEVAAFVSRAGDVD